MFLRQILWRKMSSTRSLESVTLSKSMKWRKIVELTIFQRMLNLFRESCS
jgi:hypothetical protein